MKSRILSSHETEMVERAVRGHGAQPEPPMCFVYFIQAIREGGPIKVGRTLNPAKRKIQLQNGNPLVLGYTRIVIAPEDHEARLHYLFTDFRLAGEWFLPHPALADLADAKPDPNLGHLEIDLDSGGAALHRTIHGLTQTRRKWRIEFSVAAA